MRRWAGILFFLAGGERDSEAVREGRERKKNNKLISLPTLSQKKKKLHQPRRRGRLHVQARRLGRFGKVAEAFVYDNFPRVAAETVAVSQGRDRSFSFLI